MLVTGRLRSLVSYDISFAEITWKSFFLDEKFKRNWLLQTFQFKSLKKFLLKNFRHVCSLWHWVFHSSSKLASWQSVAITENILQRAWNCGLHFPDIWELLCRWCELDLFSILWELRMCLSTCCLIKLVSLPRCSHLQLCLGCTQCIYAHFRFPPYFVQNKTFRVLDWLFSVDEEASYILTQGAHLQLCILDCQNFLILSQLLQCVSLWDPEGGKYHSKCDLCLFLHLLISFSEDGAMSQPYSIFHIRGWPVMPALLHLSKVDLWWELQEMGRCCVDGVEAPTAGSFICYSSEICRIRLLQWQFHGAKEFLLTCICVCFGVYLFEMCSWRLVAGTICVCPLPALQLQPGWYWQAFYCWIWIINALWHYCGLPWGQIVSSTQSLLACICI